MPDIAGGMDLGFAAVNNPEEWGDESPSGKDVKTSDAADTLVPSAVSVATRTNDGHPETTAPPGRMHMDSRTRYFIIKCNNHKNLVSSIQNNVWATQKHNETKLNEALRVSPYVVLLFSVNMSGSFQGYARMVGKCGASKTADPFNGFGSLFDIKWLKLHDLDFNDILHITNEWNGGLSVKISRDGQELPNHVGKSICALIDQGVYRADPGNFVVDDEVANEVPADAPPVGTALPDAFNQRRGYWKGGKGNDWQRGGWPSGGDRWRERDGPYHSRGSGEKGSSGGNGDNSWYSASSSNGTHSSYHYGGGPSSTWGSTGSQQQQVVVSSTAVWGQSQPASSVVAQKNEYAQGWGGQNSTPSTTHVVVASTNPPVTSSSTSTGHASGYSQPVTYVAMAAPPQQQAASLPSPTQGKAVGTPDFVNMSYDQYLQWYNQQGTGRAGGKEDELTTSDED